MSKESIPNWVAQEIQHAEFKESEDWSGSGYILDINKEQRKIDVQFYEKLPEGRYIATLDLPKDINPESLERYRFLSSSAEVGFAQGFRHLVRLLAFLPLFWMS